MKNRKPIMCVDVETTGLNSAKHGIISVAIIIKCNGRKYTFSRNIKPFRECEYDKKALSISRITRTQIEKFRTEKQIFKELIVFLEAHYYGEKFTPLAYNGRFDLDFMESLFKRNSSSLSKYINWRLIDPLSIIRFLEYTEKIEPLQNHKLVTVCKKYKIPIDAHKALSDINATDMLTEKLKKLLR